MRLKQIEDEGQSFFPISLPLEFTLQTKAEIDAAWEADPREPKD